MGLRTRVWRRKLGLKRQKWQRPLKAWQYQFLDYARVHSLQFIITQRWIPRCLRELPAISLLPPRPFPPGMTKGKVPPEYGHDCIYPK